MSWISIRFVSKFFIVAHKIFSISSCLTGWLKSKKRLLSRNMVHFAWIYPNKNFCIKIYRVIHNGHYWVQIYFNMFCLFVWLDKQINLSYIYFISILAIWQNQIHFSTSYLFSRVLLITGVISEFYLKKKHCKGNMLLVWIWMRLF